MEGGPRLAGIRRHIPAATEAALWALSNGRCYAPSCPFPVVVEVRPGVHRKNAQIAHIRGVRAPRFDPTLSDEECAAFGNLLLLCLPHHGEVDDKKTGEKLYPPDKLRGWKIDHEGSSGPALAALGSIDEESLTEMLLDVFDPPLKRLERIADQLEKTGTLNAEAIIQLQQVVRVMRDSATVGPDRATAAMLMDAAEVYSGRTFYTAAIALANAAEILPSIERALGQKIAQLHEAADLISTSTRGMGQYG
jgi:hypothetical protein